MQTWKNISCKSQSSILLLEILLTSRSDCKGNVTFDKNKKNNVILNVLKAKCKKTPSNFISEINKKYNKNVQTFFMDIGKKNVKKK